MTAAASAAAPNRATRRASAKKATRPQASAPKAPERKVFGYNSGGSDEEGEYDPVEFGISTSDGVVDIHTKADVPSFILLEFMRDGSNEEDPIGAAKALMTFFEGVIAPECWNNFRKAMRRPEVGGDTMIDIGMFLVEELSNRPTKQP